MLLGAGSMSDMLARIDIVKRSSGRTARLVGKVLSLKKQFERRTATLAKQRKTREAALADRAARKATITNGIRARKDRLASVKRDIRQIIAAREAAERAAAAARAAAARAAQQAAGGRRNNPADDPGHRRLRRRLRWRRLRRLRHRRWWRRRLAAVAAAAAAAAVPTRRSSRLRRPAARAVVSAALSQLGVPYKWAGSSPGEGFDCSGLTMWAYAQVGVSLPHNASAQHGMGTPGRPREPAAR